MPKKQSNMFEEKQPDAKSDEMPGNCARANMFSIVYDNDLYEVADLHIADGLGNIAYTLTRTKLHPGKQTRGNERDYNRVIEIKEGEGIFLLNNIFVPATAGLIMVVPRKVKMKVINIKNNIDLLYLQTLPSQLIRGDAKKTGIV